MRGSKSIDKIVKQFFVGGNKYLWIRNINKTTKKDKKTEMITTAFRNAIYHQLKKGRKGREEGDKEEKKINSFPSLLIGFYKWKIKKNEKKRWEGERRKKIDKTDTQQLICISFNHCKI